jgi:hypothetical protein
VTQGVTHGYQRRASCPLVSDDGRMQRNKDRMEQDLSRASEEAPAVLGVGFGIALPGFRKAIMETRGACRLRCDVKACLMGIAPGRQEH